MLRWLPKRRWVRGVLIALAVVVALIARPAWHLIHTAMRDRDERQPLPAGTVDDASRLDATNVAKIWDMPADEAAAEAGLAQLLANARRSGLHVAIAGARHSMGGQSIYPGGVPINMLSFHGMKLDEQRNLLHVQAGSLWSEVVPYLDRFGRSVEVMQSNNSFSVGGSLSVNCHGWQQNHPPIASTVESLRLMTADGHILRCSRTENAELFSLVLGGYGLFGIILDAELHVVPNERYRVEQFVVPAKDYLAAWDQRVGQSPDVGMAIGRLCVVPDSFLEQAVLYVFTRAPPPDGKLAALSEPRYGELTRLIFRGSVDSDYGKRLRWTAECDLQPYFTDKFTTRNQLLNEPAEVLANRTADSTDILHEYFVPREHFADFVARLKTLIPQHGANLLNVTVRDVQTDNDSLLRYADRDMLALVMLFNQPRTADGEVQMASLTRDLLDAALACGGRYYLPYRLHATPQQFAQAYPQAKRFFAAKRRYDPDELFQNEFYTTYGRE